ncbi:MAG: hypothetical protein CMD23_02055 [Flavobacteriales bacterium]|nr:hypothetical protein [Flavobacteriales bacterium]|tara:strand:+ start:175 stop:429 length:255 start_codon:yes stop_codon:yes gene_type:complete
MFTLFQVVLYAILLYFLFVTFIPILARFFLKRWIYKVQKDLHKKSKNKDDRKKYHDGETEVSYKKDKNIDPGGEYVDFEEFNND